MSRADDRVFNLDTTNYNSLSTGLDTNVGTYNIMIDYFFIAVRGCNNTHPRFVVNTHACVADNSCPAGTY